MRSRLIGVVVVLVATLVTVVLLRDRDDPSIVGVATDFPIGSVSRLGVTVDAPIVADLTGGLGYPALDPDRRLRRGDPGLFLVHTQAGLRALLPLDTYRGCRLISLSLDGGGGMESVSAEAEFVDPCHFSQYSLDGTWLDGPSRRDLGAFPVGVDPSGVVRIDPTRFVGGARH